MGSKLWKLSGQRRRFASRRNLSARFGMDSGGDALQHRRDTVGDVDESDKGIRKNTTASELDGWPVDAPNGPDWRVISQRRI